MTLLINKEAITKLKKYGEEHPFTFQQFKNIYKGKEKCAGDRLEYILFLPVKYKLVFSIDWCCDSTKTLKFMCRHMSISSMSREGEQSFPNMDTLRIVSSLLGFTNLDSPNMHITLKDKDPLPNVDILEIMRVYDMSQDDKKDFL